MTRNAIDLKKARMEDARARREDQTRRDIAAAQDRTNRRGQNFRLGTDVAKIIGKAGEKGKNNAETAAYLAAALNDYEWYVSDQRIGADIASGTYRYRNGIDLGIEGMFDATLPGICLIATTPGIGVSTSSTSGPNTAARNIDAFIRSKNSRSSGYDPVDIMQMLICLGNIFAIYGHVDRLIRLEQTASSDNAYVPKGILASMGIDTTESIKNLASDRARLNVLIDQINKAFPAPANLSYFKRMLFMYSHVYVDTKDSHQGQLYAYVPDGMFRYDEENGACDYCPFQISGWLSSIAGYPNSFTPTTVTEWINILNGMYAQLTKSEYANIMAADIRNAFKDEGLFVLPRISEDEYLPITYDPVVLNQMHNCTVPYTRPNYNLRILQDNASNLIYQPGWATTTFLNLPNREANTRLITTDLPDPDWKVTLEITRGQIAVGEIEDEGDAGNVLLMRSCGCDFPTAWCIYKWTTENSVGSYIQPALQISASNTERSLYGAIAAYSKFAYAPLIAKQGSVTNDDEMHLSDYYLLGNLDTVSVLSVPSLINMNNVILYNMFNVNGITEGTESVMHK